MEEVISTSGLTKVYGKVYAVNDVNLSVGKGEIFGFLGLNGAGKTTTIRMLLGMVAPTSGRCYIQGKMVSAGNTDIWRNVGYIVETPYSYPELTVRENLEIVRKLREIKDKGCVDRIIDKLKLDEYASKKTKHLSLGNAQRLGIAKALIHRPKILILDEPTNGLDPAGIVEVRELLMDLARKSGVTVLVSSHKLDEISRMATNIAIIHEGKLIKELDVAQLESQLSKSLIVDGRDRLSMKEVLSAAGFKADLSETGLSDGDFTLQIKDENAINHPDMIAKLLVDSGHPPTLLKVDKEDLEMYFLRTIKEAGGALDE